MQASGSRIVALVFFFTNVYELPNAASSPSPMTRERLVPLIVAVAMFMENMDSTVIATSLPAIAADIGSSGCALSHSLWHFVIARFLQGTGGAMMSPVGRLVLIRTVGKHKLIGAMALLTMPALVGPMLGPALGGFITTYASWHWIFLINIPIGLLGITLVSVFFENLRAEISEPFDLLGLLLIGLGVGGLAFGLTVTGIKLVPASVTMGLVAGGAMATIAYVARARGMAAPVVDLTLFRLATFRAGVAGGFIFRVGAGALPFLLPLLMQLGFGMTPFQSGLVTLSTAVGAMMMKSAVPPILRRAGFRNVLTWNALVAAVMLAACAAFTHATPVPVMIAVLLAGGFFRSLQFTSVMSSRTRRSSRPA